MRDCFSSFSGDKYCHGSTSAYKIAVVLSVVLEERGLFTTFNEEMLVTIKTIFKNLCSCTGDVSNTDATQGHLRPSPWDLRNIYSFILTLHSPGNKKDFQVK